MKASNIKAVQAMSEFFRYNVSPEEFAEILEKLSSLEDTTRDREVIRSLAGAIKKSIG